MNILYTHFLPQIKKENGTEFCNKYNNYYVNNIVISYYVCITKVKYAYTTFTKKILNNELKIEKYRLFKLYPFKRKTPQEMKIQKK